MEELIRQVKSVLRYSQGIDDPQVDQLMKDWKKNKKDFIELFGNKLIYEYPTPISFFLSEDKKKSLVNDFLNKVETYWGNSKLSNFIEYEQDGFFDNRVVKDYSVLTSGKNHPNIIKKGTKLLSSFKYFVDDKEMLNNIQSEASIIIQSNKVSGKLCLSVHPLDFLSSSETTYKWRSCHALDGDYRAGNLSYMADSTTIICYLKSELGDVFELPRFPKDVKWNSKKWRVLLFFSDDRNMIFAGRQYPFNLEGGIETIKDNILLKLEQEKTGKDFNNFFSWSDWTSYYIDKINSPFGGNEPIYLEEKYILMGPHLKPLNEVVMNEKGSLQYNDLLYSSCYSPKYSIKKANFKSSDFSCFCTSKKTVVKVGAPVQCVCCGKNKITCSDSMKCDECYEKDEESCCDGFYCNYCGNWRFGEEEHYVDGEDLSVCSECFESDTEVCEACGYRYFTANLNYVPELKKRICYRCLALHKENGGN